MVIPQFVGVGIFELVVARGPPACSFVSQALHVLGSLGIGAQGGGDALGGWVVLSVPLSDTPQPPLSPLRQILSKYQCLCQVSTDCAGVEEVIHIRTVDSVEPVMVNAALPVWMVLAVAGYYEPRTTTEISSAISRML